MITFRLSINFAIGAKVTETLLVVNNVASQGGSVTL